MTRERAIKRLEVISEYETGEDLEALHMAIKALEQEPKWIPIKTRPMTEEEKEHYRELGWDDAFLDTIYDCNLPEDGQMVLITTKYGEVRTDTFCGDVEGASFETYSDVDDVLAWMPLPEPYNAESEE